MGGMARLLCCWERPGVIAQEAGWAPQLVHTGFENLTPTVIHTLNCQVVYYDTA